jgi:hypothetical protein
VTITRFRSTTIDYSSIDPTVPRFEWGLARQASLQATLWAAWRTGSRSSPSILSGLHRPWSSDTGLRGVRLWGPDPRPQLPRLAECGLPTLHPL